MGYQVASDTLSVQLASPFGVCVATLKPGGAGGQTGMMRASESFVPDRGAGLADLRSHFRSLLGKRVLFLG